MTFFFFHSIAQWTVAHQAPPSMGFSRQEYRSGLPFPSPGDLLDSGMELASPASLALAGSSLPLSDLGSPLTICDPMDYRVHGILQARILEWIAVLFSRGIFPTQG